MRSRRLAVWLIAGVAAYSLLATVIAQGPAAAGNVVAWRTAHPILARVTGPLGLHHAFATPWFVLAVALLTCSLVACSLERSGTALRLWRSLGAPLAADDPRWSRAQAIPVRDDLSEDDCLERSATTLRALGLRVSADAGALRGVRFRWGVIGSPLFHWALVAFFVVVAISQATRSEGTILAVHGVPRPEVAASYAEDLRTGPLFAGHRPALSIEVVGAVDGLIVGGTDRGYAPRVRLTDAGRVVAETAVFPNHPLRYRGLTIHRADAHGPVVRATLSSPGFTPAPYDLMFTTDDDAPYGIAPYEGEYSAADGAPYVIRVEPRPAKRLSVSVRPQSSTTWTLRKEAGLKEDLTLPGGVVFRAESIGSYSALQVSSDLLGGWIAVVFGLVAVTVALPLFFPPRGVWLRAAPGELRLVVRSARVDPIFGGAVYERLAATCGLDPADGDAA